MKIIAIGSRGVKKDFYDLYFILKDYYPITDLFNMFSKKFTESNFNKFHYIKSLTFFDIANEDCIPINLIYNVSWNGIKDFLRKQSRML